MEVEQGSVEGGQGSVLRATFESHSFNQDQQFEVHTCLSPRQPTTAVVGHARDGVLTLVLRLDD